MFLKRRGGLARLAGLALAAALGVATGAPGLAQSEATEKQMPEATPEILALGETVWNNGTCANCHGMTGGGGGGGDYPSGPSLRTSGLTYDLMVQIVSCGLPGSEMPSWLKGAYTEVSCFGMDLGPAPAGTRVTWAFTEDEIEALVTYVFATMVQSSSQ